MTEASKRERLALAALLLVSLCLNLVGIGWGLSPVWSWAPDEIRPEQVLEPAAWSEKYPPLHRLLLSVVLKPAKAGFEASDSVPWQTERNWLGVLQRLVSILAAAGVVVLVFRTARQAGYARAALPAAAVVVVSPTFVYYAKTANLEAAYLFWFALSLLFFVRAWQGGALRDFLWCSAATIAAVTTKDQAYGLYPVLMAASLVRIARDHSELPGVWARVRATALDRRVWGSALMALGLFGAIYAVSGGVDDFVDHVKKIVGHNTMQYREFDRSLAGVASMSWSALRRSAFVTGWPLFLVAILGVVVAIRNRQSTAMVLALVPLGYFLSFIWVIGFHYVRFFLPLLPVFAILAGRGWVALARRWPRGTRAAAVMVFAWALVRCIGVGAAMLTDTRLDAERFLAAGAAGSAGESAVGVGRVTVLPWDLENAVWGKLRPEGCEFVDRERPERVVFNVSDIRTAREREILRSFEIGRVNYELEQRFLPRVKPPGWGATSSNLMFLSPEIRIFRRAKRPCIDQASLIGVLNRKASRGDAGTERALLELMLREGWGSKIDPDGRAVLLGTSHGHWTRATQPAVLALENPGLRPLGVGLRLAVMAGREYRPVPVRLQDRGEVLRLTFGRQRIRGLRLADLEPGERRLVWIWSKKAWPGQEKVPRMLGVKLLELRLEPDDRQSGDLVDALGDGDQSEALPGQ
ncbi:MAG: phospholipid carrier-dependent glycosyltransferase [bacterium]|nr:phospholipid carrier-dependent glycosyltransferase [bacterium]